ncbi:MAG: HAD family hydrolase, partial [Fibrobacteres bacterium]|nr:HAD family hydrolase [Fibrobacterota bacterium]
EKYYDLYVAGKLTFHEQRQHRIKDAFGLTSHNLPIVNEIIINFDAHYQNAWRCFDDVIPTLTSLKKNDSKIGLITNGESSQQRAKITKTGIASFFDIVVISSEVGCSKPTKKIFEIACSKLNAHESECYFIGDRIDLDIEGSYNAGMQPIWVNRKGESKTVPANTIIISNLTEILRI